MATSKATEIVGELDDGKGMDISQKYTFQYDTPAEVDKELSVEFTLYRQETILLLNRHSEG